MKILSIVVIQGSGADKVSVTTDLPNPCWPYHGYLSMDFSVAKDNGIAYIEEHFNIKPKVITFDK